jgi:hypothetical protein
MPYNFKENKKVYRNYSVFDSNRNSNTIDMDRIYDSSKRLNSINLKNRSSFSFVDKTEDKHFCPFIKHKRTLNLIAQNNPSVKKENLNLKKLYEENSSYADKITTAKWSLTNKTENVTPSPFKNTASKSKFINDMLNKNPLKQISFSEKLENDNNKRNRNINKFESVLNYLGSKQLKDNLFSQTTLTYDELRPIKVTNSQINANVNYTPTKNLIKFRHVYDKVRGYYA